MIDYGNHQSEHLTTADEVVDPVAYFEAANAPGLKEVMALYRRSLINKGVRTLENLMALRVPTPVTDHEIATALAAICEGFVEILPLLKEVTSDLVAKPRTGSLV